TLKGHSDAVWGVAWSPDGTRLASASMDQTVRVWTGGAPSGKSNTDTISATTLAQGKPKLPTPKESDRPVGQEPAAHVVTRIRRLRGHTEWVTSVSLSPDGKRALSGSHDRTVRLWDVETGKEVRQLTGHTDVVWAVAFSPDGRRAVSGGQDRTVRIWDLE